MSRIEENRYFLEMQKVSVLAQAMGVSPVMARHDAWADRSKNAGREWLEKNPAPKAPFGAGQAAAYNAWLTSVREGEDELDFRDILWPEEVDEFVATLRNAGIEEFVYTYSGSGVIKSIYALANAGCTMLSTCMVKRNSGLIIRKEGIRFRVGKTKKTNSEITLIIEGGRFEGAYVTPDLESCDLSVIDLDVQDPDEFDDAQNRSAQCLERALNGELKYIQ